MPNFAAIGQTVPEIWRFFDCSTWSLRHFEFLKCRNFKFQNGQKDQYASSCQISRRSVKPLLRYADFSIFQDGGRRHVKFSKCKNLRGGKVKGSKRITVPNLMAIGELVFEIWRFFDFAHLAPKMVPK